MLDNRPREAVVDLPEADHLVDNLIIKLRNGKKEVFQRVGMCITDLGGLDFS